MQPFQDVLSTANVRMKIALINENCERALRGNRQVPGQLARDVQVVGIRELPPKCGLSTTRGQIRLLHDLASIELQAMELGLRTLIEFPEAPRDFRARLVEITLEEALHLELCLDAIEELGGHWGQWPVHVALWQCVGPEDSLLDRILIVHRYLEGSGLDAGETIRRRLSGVDAKGVRRVTQRIRQDELEHVSFGSQWYREICRRQGLEPEDDFALRLSRLSSRLPRRLEPLAIEIRQAAGFSEAELESLKGLQNAWRSPEGGLTLAQNAAMGEVNATQSESLEPESCFKAGGSRLKSGESGHKLDKIES